MRMFEHIDLSHNILMDIFTEEDKINNEITKVYIA